MNQIINDCMTSLNKAGNIFYNHAAATFIRSALLVMVLFIIDLLLRKWVRSIFRYCLWLLVLVKLVLPPTFSLPTGIGYGQHVAFAISRSTSEVWVMENFLLAK